MTATSDPLPQLQALHDDIVQGRPASADRACQLLERAEVEGWLPLVEQYRVQGPQDSLLHLAALFQQGMSSARLMAALATRCPALLAAQRSGEYQGQTALHILVSKGNLDGAAALLDTMDKLGGREDILHTRATGSKFKGTVMDGQLALHVAALSLNKAMLELLLDHDGRLDAVNSRGDSVLHALVRFASRHPHTIDKVVDMFNFLHARACKKTRVRSPLGEGDGAVNLIGLTPRKVENQLSIWFMENKAGLTPLKLAAVLGAGRVCVHILSLDGVYRLLDTHDGLFDTHLYDVTELDPVANRLWQAKRRGQTPPSARSKVSPLDEHAKMAWGESGVCGSASRRAAPQSVLELICGAAATQAFCLINTDVVRHVVRSKWYKLRPVYFIWMAAHLAFMVGLTFHGIYRARAETGHRDDHVTNQTLNGSITSSPIEARDSLSPTQRGLVKAWPWLSVAVSSLYLSLEAFRTLYMHQAWHVRRLHHNGLYRLVLLVFSFCLIIDSVWHWLDQHNADSNVFLILALLTGGWFLTFFLRAWRKFSFFTILFQKVMVGDMFRFSIMILLELIAFSTAMYVAYLPTRSPPGLPEEFKDIWTSTLTMFRLMLGLSDLEILSEAPAAWIAVGLYLLFVLLTYVLLLNLLIAMMSQTCALVSEDRELQWHMQRLSVLLLLETLLPQCCRPLVGRRKECRRYSLKTYGPYQESRYLTPVVSHQASYADGKAIQRRQNLVRTMGFGELTLKLAPAHTNTYSAWPTGHGTKTAVHRAAILHNQVHYNFSEEQEDNYLGQTGLYDKIYSPREMSKDYEYGTSPKPLSDWAEKGEKRPGASRGFQERTEAGLSPPPVRRRHTSERKNRRTQTDTKNALSRQPLDPDNMLRSQHFAPTLPMPTAGTSPEPVVHYLAVPGRPVQQIAYLTPTQLLPLPLVNGQSNSTASCDSRAQVEQSDSYMTVVNQELFSPAAPQDQHGKLPVYQSVCGLGQGDKQRQPAVTCSHQDVRPSPRVQLIDVNDLTLEA